MEVQDKHSGRFYSEWRGVRSPREVQKKAAEALGGKNRNVSQKGQLRGWASRRNEGDRWQLENWVEKSIFQTE